MKEEAIGLKEKYSQMSKGKKIVILIIAVAILLTGYRILSAIIQPDEAKDIPVHVHTALSEMGTIHTTAPITGRIQPVQEAVIIPMAQGQVTAVHVTLGEFVTAGTLLFEIDSTQIQASYRQASSAYQAAKTAYEALSTLYREGAASRADYENAQSQYAAASAAFTQTKEAYENCRPTAPFNGYVTSLNVSVGNQAPSGQVAASIADITSLKIEAGVSEYLINDLTPGQEVELYVTGMGDRSYSGMIQAVSPAPGAGTLTYPVTITIPNESGELKAGMFAEVRIRSQEKDQVLLVPSDAPYIKEGQTWVISLDPEGYPTFHPVEVGMDNGTMVEITKGLDPGKVVVISGQPYIEEGTPVMVAEEE